MNHSMIAKKLVCVGADGASVMQGQRNGLCVRLQLWVSPYMLSIHCMAHRMNISFKIVRKFSLVSKVEYLVREVHAYFFRSPKQFLEFFSSMVLQMEKKTIKICWYKMDITEGTNWNTIQWICIIGRGDVWTSLKCRKNSNSSISTNWYRYIINIGQNYSYASWNE